MGEDANKTRGVQRVYAIKGRDFGKTIGVVVSDEQMERKVVAAIPEVARALMKRFWPGPLTLVFRASEGVPREVLGGGETVAVRISSSPVVRDLLDLYGRPLTATSANRSGVRAACSAQEAMEQVGAEVDLVLDGGPSEDEVSSTVVDVSEGRLRVLRMGKIKLGAW